MDYLFPSEPLIKRLKVSVDYADKILFYGEDNLYPQRMEQLRLRSPLVKGATHILEDFINGAGWELNNDLIINDSGDTARDLLNLVAKDFAKYDGFAIHVNLNGLGRVTEAQHIPFEYCRLGMPDKFGHISTVVVDNNWEEDPYKLPGGVESVHDEFPIYNPLRSQSDTLIPQPKGQILYYTGAERNKYPLATFDAIRDTCVTDDSIQGYEKSNVSRGFHGATIFKYPGTFESETQKAEMVKMLTQMVGPDGPGVVIAQIDEDFTGELMEQIPSNSDDALFSTTLESIVNRVLYHYNIPPALFGISPTGGVFTQLAYQESFIVYNVITRNKRDEVARIFNKIASQWWQESFEFGRIIENKFEVQEVENEKIANRLTGPTDEQLEKQSDEIAQERIEQSANQILKPKQDTEFE